MKDEEVKLVLPEDILNTSMEGAATDIGVTALDSFYNPQSEALLVLYDNSKVLRFIKSGSSTIEDASTTFLN
jgi:hypothetical protein